jgi:hypothetical protein
MVAVAAKYLFVVLISLNQRASPTKVVFSGVNESHAIISNVNKMYIICQ